MDNVCNILMVFAVSAGFIAGAIVTGTPFGASVGAAFGGALVTLLFMFIVQKYK